MLLLSNNLKDWKEMAKKGMTLAEILITLGIIGLVAAFTIPAIKQSSFEAEQKSQYKKAIATMSNAIEKAAVSMGYQAECYYPLDGTSTPQRTECNAFWSQVEQELNISKTCTSNAYTNGCIPDMRGIDTKLPAIADYSGCTGFTESNIKNSAKTYVLGDGMILIQYVSFHPLFAIDINGKKQPNKWGYDIFSFRMLGSPDTIKLVNGGCSYPETGGKTNAQMMQDAFD